MTKIVYNACFGGFSLSDAGVLRYAEIKGITLYPEKDKRFSFTTYWTVPPEARTALLKDDEWHRAPHEARVASNECYRLNTISCRDFDRADPALVQVVEELGDKANGQCARLKIEDVPAGTLYRIDEYDGNETVETKDSYEWAVA